MGRIVVAEFISLDGIVEDPGTDPGYAHPDWTGGFDRGTDFDDLKLAELQAADAQLYGRVTYEGFAAAWPHVDDEAGFGRLMNGLPKYVVSKTLRNPSWEPTTVLSGDPVAAVTALKDEIARDILVHGSSQLVHLLAAHDLVDEYDLMVFPVLLGQGRKLFADAPLDLPALFEVSTRSVGQITRMVLKRSR